MNQTTTPKLLFALVALVILAAPGMSGNNEASPAANKTAAGDSSIEYVGTALDPKEVSLMSANIKTGGPQDILIQVSMECSILTDVYSTTIEDHEAGYTSTGSAEANIDVWVEVDGTPLVVGAQDEFITFCDRVHTQELQDLDEDTSNFTIRQYQETMNANAFNWVALDLGSGWHTVEVFATITAENTKGSFAHGAVGQRTVIVEPVHFANGASVNTQQPAAEGQAAASSSAAASDSAPMADNGSTEAFDLLDWLSGLI